MFPSLTRPRTVFCILEGVFESALWKLDHPSTAPSAWFHHGGSSFDRQPTSCFSGRVFYHCNADFVHVMPEPSISTDNKQRRGEAWWFVSDVHIPILIRYSFILGRCALRFATNNHRSLRTVSQNFRSLNRALLSHLTRCTARDTSLKHPLVTCPPPLSRFSVRYSYTSDAFKHGYKGGKGDGEGC